MITDRSDSDFQLCLRRADREFGLRNLSAPNTLQSCRVERLSILILLNFLGKIFRSHAKGLGVSQVIEQPSQDIVQRIQSRSFFGDCIRVELRFHKLCRRQCFDDF